MKQNFNKLKHYRKYAEPWWSFLLFFLTVILFLLVLGFTIYGLVMYFSTFELTYLAAVATFMVGDVATLIQLLFFANNITKSRKESVMKTLEFYNRYKVFFGEYRHDIKILKIIEELPDLHRKTMDFHTLIQIYYKILAITFKSREFSYVDGKKRLFEILNTLDEILSILGEGTLNFELLMDSLKHDILDFIEGIKMAYYLMKIDTDRLDYPDNHNFAFLDKAYSACYNNSKGGKSHEKENE